MEIKEQVDAAAQQEVGRAKRRLTSTTLAWVPEAELEPGAWFAGDFDDACGCEFVWVRESKNPYLGKTQRYRWCCILTELQKLFPHLFEMVDGFFDPNTGTLLTGPQKWDSDEMPMPTHLARRVARTQGKSIEQVLQENPQLPSGEGAAAKWLAPDFLRDFEKAW